MQHMSGWEAAGYGGLLGAAISAIIAAGSTPTGTAIVWLIVALTAVVSLLAAPNRGWLTHGLPAAAAAIAAVAAMAAGPSALVEIAPCAACITICAAIIRRAHG